jgi:hypothetical protein
MRLPWRQVLSFLIGAALVVLVAWALGLFPAYVEYCYNDQTAHKECATYHIALVAFWQLGKALNWISPAVTAIATAFIGLFTWTLWQSNEKMWIATKISAKAANKNADTALIALRPWISCKVEIAGPLTYTPDGDAKFMFRFIVENVGHSPAFGVRLTPFLSLLSPKHEPSIVKLQKMAQLNRAMPVGTVSILMPGGIPIGGAELGLILFPNDPHSFNYKIPIKRADIESSCEDIKPNMHFTPEVFGLVTYTYPLADVRADTGFVRRIDNVSPDSKSGLAFELSKPVQLGHLRVADHSLWSGFAT